jgi:hypothetical protein
VMTFFFKKTRCFAAVQKQNRGFVLAEQKCSRRAVFLGNTAAGCNTRTCCQSATYPSHALLTLPLFVKDSGMRVVSLNEKPT